MIRALIFAFGLLMIPMVSSYAALPVAFFDPSDQGGMSIVSQPDGQSRLVDIDGKDAIVNSNDTAYLYVSVDPNHRPPSGSDAWLVIEFFDDMPGQVHIEYTSTKKNYDRIPAFYMTMSNKWDKTLIHLPTTDFKGMENGGSDFRFASTCPIAVSRIELYTEKPDISVASDEERIARLTKSILELPKNGRPGNGMRYVFGDNAIEVISPDKRYETPFGCNRNDAIIKLYNSLGATSVETYVTWETCEGDGYNKWDWRLWDKQFDVLKSNGMKWTPFLILGPAYSTPDWFRESKDHFPCRCLEHQTDSKIESIWNPNLKKWITRFLTAFAFRYNKDNVLESILVGISGDYGEAIYSVYGGWTEYIPGPYHAHKGFWCADKYALADYRSYMRKKYGNIDKLNSRWGTSIASFDALDFPARGTDLDAFQKKAASGDQLAARQWLDFIEWYRASMTNFADWWLAETKRIFPKTPVYLCTGGSGEPAHGSDFSEQCRVAAKNKCGVRITNEGPGYQWNNVLTRLVASAGRYYGAPFGFEPAGNIDVNTIPGRIYNATISGSDHLHDYSRNIISSKERMSVQRKAFPYLRKTNPIIPTALWYPNVAMTLNFDKEFGRFVDQSVKLREYVDHDYLDENMLRNGALKKYRILVILSGSVMETRDAELIADWINHGGTLIVQADLPIRSVEGTADPENLILGVTLDGRRSNERVIRAKDWSEISNALTDAMKRYHYPVFDMKEDYLFTSQISKTELLYLNISPSSVKTNVTANGKTGEYIIPPMGITSIKPNNMRIPAK